MLEQLRALLSANRSRRAAAYADMKAIADVSETESRNLTLDEDKVFQGLIDEIKGLDAIADDLKPRLEELEELERGIRAANKAVPFNVGGGLRPSGSPMSHPQGEAMRSLDASSRRGLVADSVAEVITRSVEKDRAGGISQQVAALSDPAYFTAFSKYLANPSRGHMSWDDSERQAFARVEEMRAVLSLASNGGVLVPTVVDASWVLSGAGSISPFRNIARMERIPNGNTYRVPVVPQVTAAYVAEGVESTDASPTVGYKDVAIHSLRSLVVGSFELQRDYPTLATEIASAFADAVNQAETEQFTFGDGTTEPEGIILALDGGASEVAPATPETFAIADVYAVLEALPARFRANASWTASLPVINDIRQFGATAGASFIADLAAGSPPVLLGKNLYENSSQDGAWNVAATADNLILLLGDFSRFCIVDSGPAEIRAYDLTGTTANYPTAQTGWLYFQRNGSKCLDINAFRVLNLATTA